MNHALLKEMFGLLHSHPRRTCPHCHKAEHRVPCPEQVKLEAQLGRIDIDAQRRIEDREAARRDDNEFVGASDGSVNWEES